MLEMIYKKDENMAQMSQVQHSVVNNNIGTIQYNTQQNKYDIEDLLNSVNKKEVYWTASKI